MIVQIIEKDRKKINKGSTISTNTIATEYKVLLDSNIFHFEISLCNLSLSMNNEDRDEKELEKLKLGLINKFNIPENKITFKKD